MGPAARVLYFGILAGCGLIFIWSAIAGVWIWTIAATITGAALAFSAPFILSQKWRPGRPRRRPRAVSRRRR